MADFNEHAIKLFIMELFMDEQYTYLTEEKMHKEYTNFLAYNINCHFNAL